MRNAYIDALYELAKHDRNVLAMISDNGAIVYDKFRQDFPKQYFNFGISEANMVAAAAGLASCGKIPFVYTIGNFLAYRACEFIRNDVCLQNMNVKIIGTGAGFSYSTLGPTHHTTEDIGLLVSMPNLVVLSPASPLEVKKTVRAAYEMRAPVYIRLGTNKEREIYTHDYDFKVGKIEVLQEGSDIALVSTGSTVAHVLDICARLKEKRISALVVNVHTLKPFDDSGMCDIASKVGRIVTIEDHSINGLGAIAAQSLASSGVNAPLVSFGLKNTFAQGYGNPDDVRAQNGLGIDDIVKKITSF